MAPAPSSTKIALTRWLPLAVLVACVAVAYACGFQHYLSLQTIAENQQFLQDFVSQHLAGALLAYFLVYVVVVALSLPGASLLTIFGGFVFGWLLSAPVSIVAATLGAAIVFKIVQTSLGAALAARAGPFVKKLQQGFEDNSFNYLLFLRLVPAFPFFAVNAVAGLTYMPLKTFVTATVLGIIPGTFVFALLGRGLGSVIDAQRVSFENCRTHQSASTGGCAFDVSVSSLVTPQLLWALTAMGLISLLPVLYRRWKARP